MSLRERFAGRKPAAASSAQNRPGLKRPTASKLFYRGDDAIKRVDEELEQQKRRREEAAKRGSQPFRFFCGVGETKEYIILDDKPDFFMYEHTIQDPHTRKWGLHKPCIDAFDNCPICEMVGPSVYTMFLSVLDLTPFKDKNGVEHDFSRKLLAVKPSQQKRFLRHLSKNETLRGALFETTRDGPKDAAIGDPVFVEYVDEEELSTAFIREWKDREGKAVTENCGEPFDYEALFSEPTREELAALVGAEATPGSKAQRRRDMGDDDDNGSFTKPDDDDAWGKDEPKRTVRSAVRRNSREPEEGRPAVGRSAARRLPIRRGAQKPQEEEVSQPRRTRESIRGKAASRAKPEDFEEDLPFDED